MKQKQFIDELRESLVKLNISELKEIIMEYEQHFDFKLEDGYEEEEICAKLGDPQSIAAQFAQIDVEVSDKKESPTSDNKDKQKRKKNKKLAVYTGLGFADFGIFMFNFIFVAWVVLLAVGAVAFIAAGVMLVCRINVAGIMPTMPYICALLFGITLAVLAVLCAVGSVYYALYFRQMLRSYARWHKNVAARAKGMPVLPSVSVHPQLKPRKKRALRTTLVITFMLFGIALIASYTVAALNAGAFEFWHVWNWFV